jgi:hypothetical protein
MDAVLQLIDSVLAFAIGPLVTILIYEGARRWRQFGVTRRSMFVLIPGMVCALTSAALSAYVSYEVGTWRTGISQEHLDKIRTTPKDWGTDLPAAKRESYSRSLAANYLAETGLIRTFVDIEGTWRDYCPTQEDIKHRDQVVALRLQQRHVTQLGWQKSAGWLAACVVAFLLGWFQVFKPESKTEGR